jgi:hypothetical protein
MCELSRLHLLLLSALSAALAQTPASAREVYKWVDQYGATHYAETLPESDVASLEVLDVSVEEAPPEAEPGAYRSTLEMADRMRADRLERERLRLEREKLRLQQLEAESMNQRFNSTPPPASYYVPYYRYPRRPFARPPHYGKYPDYPSPPGQRPPAGGQPPADARSRVYPDRR